MMMYLFDGAMGTMLQRAGLAPGYCPELWNVEHPEFVAEIHREYVASGADIIETNTFGANRVKLTYYGLEDRVAQLNEAAVKAARQGAGCKTRIAGSVGPTGKFIMPLGDLSFEEAYHVFFEQISVLDKVGVDFILLETIIDIQEMRAALLAAKAASKKPVICQLSFGADGRTVTGTDPGTAAVILEAMGADIIGANCSLGPAQLADVIKTFATYTQRPLIVQPNAGMPKLVNGQTLFPMNPEEMAAWVPKLLEAGASYLGGCCGTTPAHIKAMREKMNAFSAQSFGARVVKPATVLTSRTKKVFLGAGFPTAVIGERINPTGRKALAADIRDRQFMAVKKEALGQVKAGAAILDVNMGVPGINQAQAMKQAVEELSMLVDVPFAIDTTDPEALEAGLKAFPGRALINSVTAEPERLAQFLPLAKKYGAAVLCLPLSSDGVPNTATERVAIAQQIVDDALNAGLRPNDLLLDALVLTLAADPGAAREILATLRLYRTKFGYPAVMGLSNISYGLPRREIINAGFCAMALEAGLDAPILNPYDPLLQNMIRASAALVGWDTGAQSYSRHYVNTAAAIPADEPNSKDGDLLAQIRRTVVNGEKEAIVPLVKEAVSQKYSAMTITEKALTAAMNQIGEEFGAGRCFLPQVMLAAETMRAAFIAIKELLPAGALTSRGTVVLATVKGDIHDLGKNIVAALLENNEFKVIDLGKDVAAAEIVTAAKTYQADIVGLCALMTTTMPQIDKTIAALKTAGIAARTLVGGAVLTAEYALQAGADAYAADGVAAVNQAKHLLEEEKDA